MVHEIQYPDWSRGGELRSIVWDDEAGTVRGDHQFVPALEHSFKEKLIATIQGVTHLNDPAHDPRDFLALLYGDRIEDRGILPDSLKDVTPTPLTVGKLPEGAIG